MNKKATVIIVAMLFILASIALTITLKKNQEPKAGLDDIFSEAQSASGSASEPMPTEDRTGTAGHTQNNSTSSDANSQGENMDDMTPEELVKAAGFSPTIGISWNVEGTMEYNGGEIVTTANIVNGAFKIEKGFSVSLNGVLQECTLEYNGKRTATSTMPKLVFDENETGVLKISFIPNIGKQGDTLEMSLLHSYFPSYLVDEQAELKVYMQATVSILPLANVALKLNVPSTESVDVSKNTSEFKFDTLNSILYNSHNYEDLEDKVLNDTYGANRAVIYSDFSKAFTTEKGEKFDIMSYNATVSVSRGKASPLTVTAYGKPGNKRISVYVNNVLQPVFDGNCYLDFELKQGEQADIPITIDTTRLNEYNNIYVLIKELNDSIDPNEHLIEQSDVHVFVVQ